MAYTEALFANSFAKLTIKDYTTPTANELEIPVELTDISPAFVEALEKELVMVHSGSGKSRHAWINNGITGDMSMVIQVPLTDPLTSSTSNYTGLLHGLYSGTLPAAFSAWDFANQLPAGGNELMATAVLELTNTAGETWLITYDIGIDAFEPATSGAHRAESYTLKILSTPVVTAAA